jgi:hypothetical protein
MHYYTAKNFNSEYKINLVMVLICFTNFKCKWKLEKISKSDFKILKQFQLVCQDRLYGSFLDFERFAFSQEVGSILTNNFVVGRAKTNSIPEAALHSLNLIVKLWENKTNTRKLYLTDFIRGINIDMPRPEGLINMFFANLNRFVTNGQYGCMESLRCLDF